MNTTAPEQNAPISHEDIRKDYKNRGWMIFPLQGKAPWPGVRWSQGYTGDWPDTKGIGVILGAPSGGLVDIDLDWNEAAQIAHMLMGHDKTACFGRGSKPHGHYLVKCPDVKSKKFSLPKSMMDKGVPDEHSLVVAEIRSDGCYTMFPPSVHPSGETVEWVSDIEPRSIDAEKLQESVGVIAFFSVCLRFWPGEGSRHDAALAFAGICKWAKIQQVIAEKFIEATCVYDRERKDRLKAVSDTYRENGVTSKWKKFQEVFGFPEDVIPVLAEWLGLEGTNDFEGLNEKFGVIRDGSKVRIIIESYDPTFKRIKFDLISRQDFLLYMRESKIAQKWLKSSMRREYPNGFIFDPTGAEHEGYLNLWRGWAVEPKEGDFPKLRYHIETVLAAGDPDSAVYILYWFVWMIQNPHLPAEVAIVFRGGKGTGKGVIGRAMRSLCGQHGLHISSPKMLVGDFNNHLRDCVFVFADEAFWAGDKAAEGQFKRMITEDTLMIEAKGRDAGFVKNMLHIMMASNEDWVVGASLDERRFAVFDVSDRYKQDKGYFGALEAALPEELPCFLHYAQNLDLQGWHPRQIPSMSAALREQVLRSETAERALLRECLERGSLPRTQEGYHRPNEAIVSAFVEVLQHSPGGRYVKEKAVGLLLGAIPGAHRTQNSRLPREFRKGGEVVLKRCTAYYLPPLRECRQWFDPQASWDGQADWVHEITSDIEPASPIDEHTHF